MLIPSIRARHETHHLANTAAMARKPSCNGIIPCFLFLLYICPPATLAATPAKISTVKAEPRKGRTGVEFFTSVKSIYNVVVRSSATGTLEDIHLVPGDHVTRGEQLGRLGGTTYNTELASARSSAKSTARALALARDQLKVDKARYPLLVDRGTIDQGKLVVARDRSNALRAKVALSALEKHGIVKSPVNGTVSQLLSSNGDRVTPGDRLLIIQPSSKLWLVGSIYARYTGRLRPGMHGDFQPASGGPSIPVRVVRVFPQGAGNGIGIGLLSVSPAPDWYSGEGGMVSLDSPSSKEPAVPDRALVLYKGHWWVIRKSNGQLKPVQVVPDGSRDGWTWIGAGLQAGTSVVVSEADLIFHKSFAKKYSGD